MRNGLLLAMAVLLRMKIDGAPFNKDELKEDVREIEDEVEELYTSLQDMRVHGTWGEWSDFVPCSAPCGGGKQHRIRLCNDGLDCLLPGVDGERSKDQTEIQRCNTEECPVHGNWGEWSDFGQCSVSCGGGEKHRIRFCNYPHGGLDCLLPGVDGKRSKGETEIQRCNTDDCPGKEGIETIMSQIEHINEDGDVQNVHEVDIMDIPEEPKEAGNDKRNAVRDPWLLWTSRDIAYELDKELTDEGKKVIPIAIDYISNISCIKFHNKTSTDEQWLRFILGSGCYSSVGRRVHRGKGVQEISIGHRCEHKGIVLHEILHALGFYHEQSRYDRDSYIKINWENIYDGMESNFKKHSHLTTRNLGTQYDYQSVMHYGKYDFSNNREPTIVVLREPDAAIGQREGLSEVDKVSLQRLYHCENTNALGETVWTHWSAWGGCHVFKPRLGDCETRRYRYCGGGVCSCNHTKHNGEAGCRQDTLACTDAQCRLDGHWGRWSAWSHCDAKGHCRNGKRYRSRRCDNPHPTKGGAECVGFRHSHKPCGSLCPTHCTFNDDSCGYNLGTPQRKWTRNRGNTQTALTGPSDDADGGGMYVYTRPPGFILGGTVSRMESREFDATEGPQCFSLQYHMYGKGMGSVAAYVSVGGVDTKKWEMSGNQGNQWHKTQFDVNSTVPFTMAFEGTLIMSFNRVYGESALDNLFLHDKPCVGQWGTWREWSSCTKACGTGTRHRNRFCDDPTASGVDCVGNRVEVEECNVESCIVGRSCKDMKVKMELEGKQVMDGVYTIKPTDSLTLQVYCDMTRDGGGWTLLVSSHTNTWSGDNVRRRNVETPDIYRDYSILDYGNDLKDSYLVKERKFQYRVEANTFGKWGGIWEAPTWYDMTSPKRGQDDVILLQRFSDWKPGGRGLQNRLPYIDGHRITFGGQDCWGSITGNEQDYHPSKWIDGKMKMRSPEHVWYWLREGDYENPQSCLDVMFRVYGESNRYLSGLYLLEPRPGQIVQGNCDFDRHGGGWTLLVKSSFSGGWDQSNYLERNWLDGNSDEYSIFDFVDQLKGDVAEESFEYMLEADGTSTHGGIFSLPFSKDKKEGEKSAKPTLIKKFGDWDESIENIAKYPIRASHGILGATSPVHKSQGINEVSGVILSENNAGTYMTSHKRPSYIKLWIREGGSRRSCNDIKIRGYQNGKTDYKDGFYMLKGSQHVYCDMTTTEKEGWTLLVTAASTGWSKDQVLQRNRMHPSLYDDFSILGEADSMKSLSTSTHFKYMITAHRRGHWGGIWKAPMEYSFTTADTRLWGVELIKQFDEWEYDILWKGPRNRMPYLETREDQHDALLTTANYPEVSDWGSIISNTPSRWIYPEMKIPGLIWYWLNENDCNANYTQHNGGWSSSSWSSCSVSCGGDGYQTRTRVCNNPSPSCGGEPCGISESMEEKRECRIPCPLHPCEQANGGCADKCNKDGDQAVCSCTDEGTVLGQDNKSCMKDLYT